MGTAGGLAAAPRAGREAGCDLIQVFTSSPQQWKSRPLDQEQAAAFLEAQQETGVACIAAHDSYLINPAAADAALLDRSRQALLEELRRCALLRIPYLVMHQGAAGGGVPDEEALERLIASVRWLLEHAPDGGPVLLLENTAGQGTTLGHRLEQTARVLDAAAEPERLGVCLDTCHLFAAGYDLRDPESYAETMAALERHIGAERVRLIHANDSRRELGSRVDRHEHIGRGHLGRDAFRLLLTDPRFASVPVILETPKDGGMDPVNLAALRAAAGAVPLPS